MKLKQLLDAADDPLRYDLVLLADRSIGDGQGELEALLFADVLTKEPWWPRVKGALNLWVLTGHGQDFHSRAPLSGDTTMEADWARLLPFVRGALPQANAVGLFATDIPPGRGTGGADVFGFTAVGTNWQFHALHEMGHGVAALADEYVFGAQAWNGPEPVSPNVTANPDPATCKWSRFFPASGGKLLRAWRPGTFLTAGTPVPATECHLREGGARFFRFDLFRPTDHCRMGGAKEFPFCAVCEDAIVRKLSAYLPGGIKPPEPDPIPAPAPLPPDRLTFLDPSGRPTYYREVPAGVRPEIIHFRSAYYLPIAPTAVTYRPVKELLEIIT